jgi:small ligand-binding sensory domain FIST
MKEWIRMAMRRDIVMRSLNVGVVVATILAAINQGDVLFAGGA